MKKDIASIKMVKFRKYSEKIVSITPTKVMVHTGYIRFEQRADIVSSMMAQRFDENTERYVKYFSNVVEMPMHTLRFHLMRKNIASLLDIDEISVDSPDI
jgi:hypothetical protein